MIKTDKKVLAVIAIGVVLSIVVLSTTFSTLPSSFEEHKSDLITLRIYYPSDYTTDGPATYNYYNKESITIKYHFEVTSTNIHVFLNTMFIIDYVDWGTSKQQNLAIYHYEGGYDYYSFTGEYTLDYADFGESWHTFSMLARVSENILENRNILTFFWGEKEITEEPTTTTTTTTRVTDGPVFETPLPLMFIPFILLAVRRKRNAKNE